jgi:putative transposase
VEKNGVSSLRVKKQLGIKERIRHREQSTPQTECLSIRPRDVLTDILRQGAQEMLATAIENEVAEYLERHASVRDGEGHRLVVRNGHLPARQIQTGLGRVAVQQPRVHDRRTDDKGQRRRFSRAILPPYLRRTQSLDELIPWLYLRGISTGDFTGLSKPCWDRRLRGSRPPTSCV